MKSLKSTSGSVQTKGHKHDNNALLAFDDDDNDDDDDDAQMALYS